MWTHFSLNTISDFLPSAELVIARPIARITSSQWPSVVRSACFKPVTDDSTLEASWSHRVASNQLYIECESLVSTLGVVACTCNLATQRLNFRTAWVRDHYRAVVYVDQASALSSVSTWSAYGNVCCTRFDNEERTGPGRKRSRQKFPRWAVVG